MLLGANQAFAWSMTVIMKVDLVGPKRRGLALGLNEFAGYFAVGVMSAWVTGYIAGHYALRPSRSIGGSRRRHRALVLSIFVRETRGHVAARGRADWLSASGRASTVLRRIFYVTTWAT